MPSHALSASVSITARESSLSSKIRGVTAYNARQPPPRQFEIVNFERPDHRKLHPEESASPAPTMRAAFAR